MSTAIRDGKPDGNMNATLHDALDQLSPEPCRLLFAGDDSGDVEAMWQVGVHDGITIGVGHSLPITAEFELQDCHAVGVLLDDFCHALGCGGSCAP